MNTQPLQLPQGQLLLNPLIQETYNFSFLHLHRAPLPRKPCPQDISVHRGSLSPPYQVWTICYNTEKTEAALNYSTNRHQKRSHLQRGVLTEHYNLFFHPQWPWLELNPGQTANIEIYWLWDKWGYYSSQYADYHSSNVFSRVDRVCLECDKPTVFRRQLF